MDGTLGSAAKSQTLHSHENLALTSSVFHVVHPSSFLLLRLTTTLPWLGFGHIDIDACRWNKNRNNEGDANGSSWQNWTTYIPQTQHCLLLHLSSIQFDHHIHIIKILSISMVSWVESLNGKNKERAYLIALWHQCYPHSGKDWKGMDQSKRMNK